MHETMFEIVFKCLILLLSFLYGFIINAYFLKSIKAAPRLITNAGLSSIPIIYFYLTPEHAEISAMPVECVRHGFLFLFVIIFVISSVIYYLFKKQCDVKLKQIVLQAYVFSSGIILIWLFMLSIIPAQSWIIHYHKLLYQY
jgi:hypothetical protein